MDAILLEALDTTLKSSITTTFLKLGDMTSRNLEYSYRADVRLSYGEETITETNLLEIRRRHPERVHIRTFTKAQEAVTGADWEWHIIGRKRTAKMRVQAKRIQRDNVLKIKHEVPTSGAQQRQLLIEGAAEDNMKPVYCIYCTEQQRSRWKEARLWPMYKDFQAGCLLADASDVPLTTRRLGEIEDNCIPWHYLFNRSDLAYGMKEVVKFEDGEVQIYHSFSHSPVLVIPNGDETDHTGRKGWNAATIDDLNEDTDREFDRTGIEETTNEDRERLLLETPDGWRIAQYDQERLRKRGIQRMMIIDVQEPDSEM